MKLDTEINQKLPEKKSVENDKLQAFLKTWDLNYKNKIEAIDLFNTEITANYTDWQKAYSVKIFYHIRGHFHKFLWLLGNKAPSKQIKHQILHNIEEEFGNDNPSHEQLYFNFANALGLDIENEFIFEKHNLPFVRKFNLGHLEWLNENNWLGKWATFSAYERLDNIDYGKLLNLARSFGATEESLTFFIVHNKADHFDQTYSGLIDAWETDQDKVVAAFNFIGTHQLNMWKSLSKVISEQ